MALNPFCGRALPVFHFQFPDVGLGAADRIGDLLQGQFLRLAQTPQACSEHRSHGDAPVVKNQSVNKSKADSIAT
jgi:hypothetical protein